MNSGRIFTEPRSGEVNILPLFTEIEKNNCFSIYTGSDLNNIFRRKPLKIDLIDLSIHTSLSLVFICRENPRRSGILLFPDRPRFCRLMKTRNRRYPRSSGMNGDKSGESGAFLFSRRVPDFYDGRRSFPTNENSNLYRRGRWRPSAMDFAQYQSPKLLGSSPPITCKHDVFRKSGTDFW